MAAAFATYLGPYKHAFRRKMLTIYWPECLQERGVPLLFDDAPHTVIDTESIENIKVLDSEVSFVIMMKYVVCCIYYSHSEIKGGLLQKHSFSDLNSRTFLSMFVY